MVTLLCSGSPAVATSDSRDSHLETHSCSHVKKCDLLLLPTTPGYPSWSHHHVFPEPPIHEHYLQHLWTSASSIPGCIKLKMRNVLKCTSSLCTSGKHRWPWRAHIRSVASPMGLLHIPRSSWSSSGMSENANSLRKGGSTKIAN